MFLLNIYSVKINTATSPENGFTTGVPLTDGVIMRSIKRKSLAKLFIDESGLSKNYLKNTKFQWFLT